MQHDSNSGTNPTPEAPSAPTGLTAAATSTTTIQVTWNQVSSATGYEVDRAEGSGAFSTVQSGLSATFYQDTGLQPNTQYRYQVRAVNGSQKSSNSSAASATTPPAQQQVKESA